MKTSLYSLLFLSAIILPHCQSAAAPDGNPSRLVTQFWRAQDDADLNHANSQLLAASPNVETLYQWLKAGPEFSSDVPTGLMNLVRVSDDGIEFPYAIRVPENYDPQKAYPIEFNLHGGVNRPKLDPNESPWSERYEELSPPDSIIVVPVGWSDAFWWQDSQAENLPAILRSVKQSYNVDDNRAIMTGVSDGGTGTYFFAFMQPTEWAAFVPFIGHPGVLRNPRARVSHPINFTNLKGKPIYIVNSENDRLYPSQSILPYVKLLEEASADFEFTMIPNGGHNLDWMPGQRAKIDHFKQTAVRDPLPENVRWSTTRTDRYNRNHWLIIDELRSEGQPGRLMVEREDNEFDIIALYVRRFTLLLNPEEIDFTEPVVVRVNGITVFEGMVEQSAETLLKWASKDRDRQMLFTAELALKTTK